MILERDEIMASNSTLISNGSLFFVQIKATLLLKHIEIKV